MITPDEIRTKAARLYPQVVAAWLRDEEIFPRLIPANLETSKLISEAITQQQALRAHSKAARGYGYSLRMESRRSRDYGEQDFPTAVIFDSRDDLLKLIGKLGEFQRLTKMVNEIRLRQPQLKSWTESNWKRLIGLEGELSQLLDVVEYLQDHPRPGCFIRELPLAISTKLVEEHTNILAPWLDELLPADCVDFGFDRHHFAARYGFRSVDDQLWIRILDPTLQIALRCPGGELGLPITTLAALPVEQCEIILVENKINLLTLPPLAKTLALGGLGQGITQLFRIEWLSSLPIKYFGDIDVEGLRILAMVRDRWPQTQSLMMDRQTLDAYSHLIIPGNRHAPDLPVPVELTPDEAAAFIACRDQQLRLEQERIPQFVINQFIAGF
ncbi:MAG: hypothetical protein IT423_05310 [Pirellulaceae bacterium]|nr:hypothetical protein [Pirellulaceae bacterium]